MSTTSTLSVSRNKGNGVVARIFFLDLGAGRVLGRNMTTAEAMPSASSIHQISPISRCRFLQASRGLLLPGPVSTSRHGWSLPLSIKYHSGYHIQCLRQRKKWQQAHAIGLHGRLQLLLQALANVGAHGCVGQPSARAALVVTEMFELRGA